jgi:hypothetical protein
MGAVERSLKIQFVPVINIAQSGGGKFLELCFGVAVHELTMFRCNKVPTSDDKCTEKSCPYTYYCSESSGQVLSSSTLFRTHLLIS